jgi:hypothetical protein
MKKPRYGRTAQEKSVVQKGTTFTSVLGSGYNKRWFVLDKKNRRLTYFKTEDIKIPEQGYIDLNAIIDVQISKVYDAPDYSLDLISDDRHYTIVAESHDMMLKWALALHAAIPESSLSQDINLNSLFERDTLSSNPSIKVESQNGQSITTTHFRQTLELVDESRRNFSPHPKLDHHKSESIDFSYLKSNPVFDEIIQNNLNHDGITDDLCYDCFEIVNESHTEGISYYPFSLMTSSSLLNVKRQGEGSNNDQFLQLLTESHRGTNRAFGNLSLKLKITIISTDSSGGSKSMEFADEYEYWNAVLSIKRMFLEEDIFNSGKCMTQISTSTDNPNRGAFLHQILTQSGHMRDDCLYEFKTPIIKVSCKGSEIFSVTIANIRAVILSSDFEPIRPYLLEISLNPHIVSKGSPKDITMIIMDSEGILHRDSHLHTVTVSKTHENDTIFTPLCEDDVNKSSLYFGSSKIALVNLDKLTGKSSYKYFKPKNNS